MSWDVGMHTVSQSAIFGSAHSGKAFDSATCDPQYVAVQERIVQLYQTSALQQQAVYQIVTDVTRSVEGETEPEDFDATHFVQKLIETLLVHGACVWRPGSSSVQVPEILDPMSFYVEQRRSKYVPRRIPSVYRNTAKLGNKWHLVLLETPLTEFDPGAKKWITRAPRSCAARAVKCSLAIEELQLHRRQRNLHNSQPTVFLHDTVRTTSQAANSWVDMYSKSIDAHKAYGDGPRRTPNANATNVPTAPVPGTFSTRKNALTAAPNARTVADRMQNFISAQADITASVRNALTTAPLKVGHTPGEVVDPFRDGRPAHAEMVLAEGSNHTLMRHLEGRSFFGVCARAVVPGWGGAASPTDLFLRVACPQATRRRPWCSVT